MTTKQLSIFLENRIGRTKEVVEILSGGGIDIKAFTIADSAEFGILRLIVSDIDGATSLLKAAGISVVQTDVLWLPLEERVGALADVLGMLAAADVSVEYMYVCYSESKPYIVIRPIQMAFDKCEQILG